MRRFQRETFLIKINPSNGWLCPRLFYNTVFLQQISSLLFFAIIKIQNVQLLIYSTKMDMLSIVMFANGL